MKNFKKVLLMALSLVLVAALAIVGTIAYLTDTDSKTNVMTVGSVDIEQIEQEYDENGELVEFTQAKPLMPYVGELGWKNTEEADGAYRSFTMNNVVDKYVSVENKGKSDAFVRTLFAFEMGEYATVEAFRNNIIGISRNAADGAEFDFDGTWVWGEPSVAQINGENYMIWEAVHETAVAPKATTIPSLLQVYMNKECDNAEVVKVDGNKNGTYDILVLSQAVQTAGFADAATALNEAFGTPAEKAAEWFGGMVIPVIASGTDVVDNILAEGGQILLNSNVGSEDYTPVVSAGAAVTVDMKGYTVDAKYFNNSGDLTLENGILESGTSVDYGFIAHAGSNTVLNDVDFKSAGGGVGATDGSYVEINGGCIDVSTTSTSGRYNVYAVGAGTKVVINDGTFSFSKTLNQKRAYIYAGAGATVIVNGGTFGPASTRDGYTAGILGEGTVIITGGTFGFNPSAWVADDYEAVQNGSVWTVSAK